jgi:hypothetical protein
MDGRALQAADDGDGYDGRENAEEEDESDVLFEEDRKDAGGAGKEVGGGGISATLQEIEGQEDGEDGVAIVDGMWVDGVDAEDGERRGEEERKGPPTSRSKMRRFWLRRNDELRSWCSEEGGW